METQEIYRSFNSNKSIEELRYIMMQHKKRIQYLEEDLEFLKFLMNRDIFKSRAMNLFENLELFKKELNKINVARIDLLNEISVQTDKIRVKIESKSLFCDNTFIQVVDSLEYKAHQFFTEWEYSKLQIIQYLKSVL